MASDRLNATAERLVYRIAGLPVAITALLPQAITDADDPLRAAFAWQYWRPDSPLEWSELACALLVWPIAVLIASAVFTMRNGASVRRRHGKGIAAQFAEQLRLYATAGVLPPWYYIFSLHDEGAGRASTFIQRFETKTCYFRVLKRRKGTPLNCKKRFASYCAEHGVRCVETLMVLDHEHRASALPERDLFIKPTNGRGGTGAERWDYVGSDLFQNADGGRLPGGELLNQLASRSATTPLIVQPRLCPHPDLAEITSGALPTIRVLTCLSDCGEPEVIAAVLRMSVGRNTTVDNLHAGGIGANVELETGALSSATNLGSDARLGWVSRHPDSGAPIEGRIVPCWNAVKSLAVSAHRHFADRVVIGWDIAIVEDGPVIVEGNGNPDLDILQRFMRVGLRKHRLGDLLAHHMRDRGPFPSKASIPNKRP